jgi:hypothetical protein
MGYFDHINFVVGVCVSRKDFFELFKESLKTTHPTLYDETSDDDDTSLMNARMDFIYKNYKPFFEQLWPGQKIKIYTAWNSDDTSLYIGRRFFKSYNQTWNPIDPEDVILERDQIKGALNIFNDSVELHVIVNCG